jgi:hypothetical protein
MNQERDPEQDASDNRPADVPQCVATLKNGSGRCPNASRTDRQTCYSHRQQEPGGAPEVADVPGDPGKVAQALRRARTHGDVQRVLAEVAALVLSGKVNPRVGAAVSQLATATLKAIDDHLRREMAELLELAEKHQDEVIRGFAKKRRPRR